jgi:hypothetical protein
MSEQTFKFSDCHASFTSKLLRDLRDLDIEACWVRARVRTECPKYVSPNMFFLIDSYGAILNNGAHFAVGWLALQYVTVKVPCSILGFESDIVAVRL